MHGFAGELRASYKVRVMFAAAGRMMRQLAQSSSNYEWGCGKISVANDAKVNFKGDSNGSEEKSKEKSS